MYGSSGGSSYPLRPGPDERLRLKRTFRPTAYTALALIVLAGAAGVYAFFGWLHARAFDHGYTKIAHVVSRSYGRYEDLIHVVYTTGQGDVIEVRIPVDTPSDFQLGSDIVIVVDPGNPRHVRTLEGWTPPYQIPSIVAVVFFLIALLVWSATQRMTRGLWKAAQTGEPHQVLLSRISVPGARGSRFWRVLVWNPAQPPPAEPILQVRTAEPDGDVGTVERGTVIGEMRHRGFLVIKDESGFTWPQGRAWHLTRATRKALAQIHVEAPEPRPADVSQAGRGPAVPALDEGSVGTPLPPEFFRKEKDKESSRALMTVGRVVLAVIVVGLPFFLFGRIGHHSSCAGLPSGSSLGSDVRPASNDELVSIIRELPHAGDLGERNVQTFTATQLTPPTDGYESGAEIEYRRSNGEGLFLEILQFDSNQDALKHWAGTWVTYCAYRHSTIPVTGDATARGTSIAMQDGGFDQRVYFVRYGRLYRVLFATRQTSTVEVTSEAEAIIQSNL